MLTNLNNYPDFIVYLDQHINGEPIDEKLHLINEFKVWLSQQVQQNGELLNDKTISQKISSLKSIEVTFTVIIFGETDTEALKNIKETVLNDETYDRYKGVSGSSIDYYIRYVESRPSARENESYSREDFLSEVYIDEYALGKLQSVLQNKKNLILKGAPGVGKTFIADRLAYLMMEEKDDSRIQMIQFHQSYSYEDFIEGYRPKVDSDGFELKQGPFVKFARKASRDPERDYFFIIDEINRGNMSKILGELMMLIETDKRGKSVNLLYSNEKFSVPANLYIIGMMNTADRSLALLDYALRRRFSFYDIAPAFENSTFTEYINNIGSPIKMIKVIEIIISLNKTIIAELGKGFQIGHSYFVGDAFSIDAESRLIEVVEYEIIPQLYEYWFDDEDKAESWANKLRNAYDGKKL
ncbi:AAA family ATPase [Enterococcus sp.]